MVVKVVIGANWGDEGKGLMTDVFAREGIQRGEKVLGILTNGGPQRSHTVSLPDGTRHAFRHVSSGTFAGADSFLGPDFMVNPLVFRQEIEELMELGADVRCFADPRCRMTTPYDMFVNQIVEESRGANRHGSCGYGIWETFCRYENDRPQKIRPRLQTWAEMVLQRPQEAANVLREIRTYAEERLKGYGIREIPAEWREIWNSQELIERYIREIRYMVQNIRFAGIDELKEYGWLVLENGQGVCLDQDNLEEGEHTTASQTGLAGDRSILENLEEGTELEVCYVTRTYFTRHGNGYLPGECAADAIMQGLRDETNVPNAFQGSIRYAPLQPEALVKRITGDIQGQADITERFHTKTALAITHMNEAQPEEDVLNRFKEAMDHLYVSGSRFGEEVERR